jgi:hypothetical protein
VAADWGNVPEWLAGVGTVGTLVYGLRLLAHERERSDRAQDDARRAQAACLSASIETRQQQVGSIRMRMHYRVVVVSNASASPVYDVRAQVCAPQGRSYLEMFWPVIRPGEVEESIGPAPHLPKRDDLLVDLWFQDAAGRHWRRDLSGALMERYRPAPRRRTLWPGRRTQALRHLPPGDVPPLTDPRPPDPAPSTSSS